MLADCVAIHSKTACHPEIACPACQCIKISVTSTTVKLLRVKASPSSNARSDEKSRSTNWPEAMNQLAVSLMINWSARPTTD